jgi:hypothetical protein
MNKEYLWFAFEVTLILVMVVSAFFLGFGFGKGKYKLDLLNNIKPYTDSCDYDDLSKVVECLNHEFNSFYVYNLSQAGKTLNEEQLREQGGVCTHATEWYEERLNNLNIRTMSITMWPIDTKIYSGHIFLIAYDDTIDTYCWIDQYDYKCVRLQ